MDVGNRYDDSPNWDDYQQIPDKKRELDDSADISKEQPSLQPGKRKKAKTNEATSHVSKKALRQKPLTNTSAQQGKKRARSKSDSFTDELPSRATKAMHRSIQNVRKQPVNVESVADIFRLESKFREVLSAPNFPEKEKYQQIYEEKVLPLLNKAKIFIKQHPMQFSVQAAASKGKAASVGFQALQSIKEKNVELKANVKSAQEVVLLPEYGAVLKQMDPRAKEESYLADSLFDLMAQAAVVGTFNITQESDTKQKTYEAKPFIKMVLIGDLKKNPEVLEKVFEKLSPDAEFNAILTGEIQLLDLHSANLAVVPVPSANAERFIEFKIPPDYEKSISLQELIIKNVQGELSDRDAIQYKERVVQDGQQKEVWSTKRLNALPQELQQALNCPWKFVLFDTDLSMGEDNRLQLQISTKDNKDPVKEHLIPLRSCLLESNWKDQPLSEQTVNQLINSSQRDARVKNWIQRQDAPIYQHLSAQARARIEAFINPKIEQYSLSDPRRHEKDEGITIHDLRNHFVKSLVKDTQENREFWKFVQSEVGYTLNSASKKMLAKQLFPRLTISQQNALLDRQTKRKEYLEGYMELSQSKQKGIALIEQMQNYINRPEAPLNTARKQQLQDELNWLKSVPDGTYFGSFISFIKREPYDPISSAYKALCKEVQPTYFNLMKAMYPLLADVFTLTEAVHGKKAGGHIGFFGESIETVIDTVRTNYSDGALMQLADHIEQEISLSEDSSFFGFQDVSTKPKYHTK